MWELSKNFTIELFKSASHKLTSLIYTAWLNAGSPVSVDEEINIQTPVAFSLLQNYPNPFNPSTTIRYTIPIVISTEGRNLNVQLKVYDALGNEVATLVNQEKPAGSYEVNFNAIGLSSGVYFYQLHFQGFIEIKKMIFLQ